MKLQSEEARLEIVRMLIACRGDPELLRTRLAGFPFDYEGEPVVLTATDILNVVERVRAGDLTFDQGVAWANAVEFRDDIRISASTEEREANLHDALFLLSTPEISGLTEGEVLERVEASCLKA